MVDDIDTDFAGVDLDGADADADVSDEMLDALDDFDGEEIEENQELDLPDTDTSTDTDKPVNNGGPNLSEPVRVARDYVEALTGIEHTVTRETRYGRTRVLIQSPVVEIEIADANESSDCDITFPRIKGGISDEIPGERPVKGPKALDEMRDVTDERGREDLKPASAFEDDDAGTGDRDLVSLAESYTESYASVKRVETVDVAGYDAVASFDENGNRFAVSAVVGDDVSAAGTVIPEMESQEGMSELIVEDGCVDALDWVADSISIMDRSDMQTHLNDTGDTANEDDEDDDGEEVDVKSIPELADYMTAAEMWGDASTWYADGNNEQAREMVAGALMAEMDWLCVRESSEYNDYDLRVYVPERGCYVEGGVDVLEERMTQVLGGLATKGAEISKIKQLVANNCKVDLDDTDGQAYDETLIPFRNGVLVLDSVEYDTDTGTIDPSTAELREKSPEYNFTHALPVEWDPEGCDVDLVEQWMGDMTAGEETKARTLWEAGGHALLPRYEPQGFIIAIAEGANGKTTLFNVFLEALGEENTTAIPLDKITDSQFSSYRMVDRLMNMHADISGATLDDVSALKAATGDDRMEVERKGIDPWDARNRATQLMAANSPPAVVEQDKAVKRRLMPIILDVEFVTGADPENPYEIEKDPGMEDKLTTDSALAGIVFKFVEAARRLQEQKEFTMAEEYGEDERMQLYESHADPVADFDRECLERDPDGTGIAIDDIKACYDAFSVDKDHPTKTKETLIRMLKKRATTVMRRSDPRSWTDDDSRIGVYKGMKFSEKAKENWLPEDAHWDKYGRPGTDEDGVSSTESGGIQGWASLGDITSDDTKVDLKVTVESAGSPRYNNDDGGALKDGTDDIEYRMPTGSLDEGQTYAITGALVREDKDGHVFVELFNGVTDWQEIDVDGDQIGLSGDDDDDSDGDGEVVNGDADDTSIDTSTTAGSVSASEVTESQQDAARADGGNCTGDSEQIDRVVLQHAEMSDSVAVLSGAVTSDTNADLKTVKYRIKKLRERGDIILNEAKDDGTGDTANTDADDTDDPERPISTMHPHDVQCRECGYWGPVVGFFGECGRCGAELDVEWNMNERTLTEDALRTAKVQDSIVELEEQHDEGAPIDEIIPAVEDRGVDQPQAEHCIDKLWHDGSVSEPKKGHLRTTSSGGD